MATPEGAAQGLGTAAAKWDRKAPTGRAARPGLGEGATYRYSVRVISTVVGLPPNTGYFLKRLVVERFMAFSPR